MIITHSSSDIEYTMGQLLAKPQRTVCIDKSMTTDIQREMGNQIQHCVPFFPVRDEDDYPVFSIVSVVSSGEKDHGINIKPTGGTLLLGRGGAQIDRQKRTKFQAEVSSSNRARAHVSAKEGGATVEKSKYSIFRVTVMDRETTAIRENKWSTAKIVEKVKENAAEIITMNGLTHQKRLMFGVVTKVHKGHLIVEGIHKSGSRAGIQTERISVAGEIERAGAALYEKRGVIGIDLLCFVVEDITPPLGVDVADMCEFNPCCERPKSWRISDGIRVDQLRLRAFEGACDYVVHARRALPLIRLKAPSNAHGCNRRVRYAQEPTWIDKFVTGLNPSSANSCTIL